MITDSALPYEKANKSESNFNASISSSFVSKETNSAVYRNEVSYAMPSDSRNHMPDRSPSVLYDSTYFHRSEFEDQSAWTSQVICSKESRPSDLQLGDYLDFNFEDLLKLKFDEEIVQEDDSSRLMLLSTNCEHPETSKKEDSNQDRLICSDLPTVRRFWFYH